MQSWTNSGRQSAAKCLIRKANLLKVKNALLKSEAKLNLTSLRRVYTSRLRMRLPHCVAFFYYLPWFVDVYGKKSYYFENAMHCGKRMRKPDVATRL